MSPDPLALHFARYGPPHFKTASATYGNLTKEPNVVPPSKLKATIIIVCEWFSRLEGKALNKYS